MTALSVKFCLPPTVAPRASGCGRLASLTPDYRDYYLLPASRGPPGVWPRFLARSRIRQNAGTGQEPAFWRMRLRTRRQDFWPHTPPGQPSPNGWPGRRAILGTPGRWRNDRHSSLQRRCGSRVALGVNYRLGSGTPPRVPKTATPEQALHVATVAEITSRTPATTLLAGVEPCSEPDAAPPRDLLGHHAACQRGAMFKTRHRPAHGVRHLEHRSTLASSVVAKQRISRGIHLWS